MSTDLIITITEHIIGFYSTHQKRRSKKDEQKVSQIGRQRKDYKLKRYSNSFSKSITESKIKLCMVKKGFLGKFIYVGYAKIALQLLCCDSNRN